MSCVNNQLAQLFWNVQRFELWFVGFVTKVCLSLWTEWVIVTLHLWWVEFWLVFFFEKGLTFLLDQMDYNETSLMINRTLVCFLFDKGSIFFWIRWTTMWFHLWLVELWLVFFVDKGSAFSSGLDQLQQSFICDQLKFGFYSGLDKLHLGFTCDLLNCG